MAKLPKFTLSYEKKKDAWALKNDRTDRVIRRFDTKEEATIGGVLKDAVGQDGGSVKIQKRNRRFLEERTYPRSKDPRRSRG